MSVSWAGSLRTLVADADLRQAGHGLYRWGCLEVVDRAGGYAGLPVVRFTPTLHPTGGLRWATTGGVMLLSCNDERKANPGD